MVYGAVKICLGEIEARDIKESRSRVRYISLTHLLWDLLNSLIHYIFYNSLVRYATLTHPTLLFVKYDD